VGSLAVQIAATRGARVIAVASAHHHAILRDLGAEACIDYHDCDVARAAQEIAGVVDAVADFVGGDTVARSLVALHPYGRAATIASLHGDLDLALDRNVTIHGVLVRPDRSVLDRLREMVDAGTVRPLVDTVLPLEGAPEAHRRLESGHGRGKVILRVR
jgi:NADPH2:quinone reductase